ncbi:MAG: DUF3500 domain-containing protein [Nocardioides sp.]
MREAVAGFLDALTHEQRRRACLPFTDHQERMAWSYYPRRFPGISLGDLNHRQRKAAQRLLRSGLSPSAYARARQVMAIEDVLDDREGYVMTAHRDSELYSVIVFVGGDMFFEPVRGWRFEGHHLSVNYTFDQPGAIGSGIAASTPLFLGANPARIRHDGYDVFRPFGDAEDLGRDLVESLSSAGRAAAIVRDAAPADVVLANLPLVGDSQPALDLPILQWALANGADRAAFADLRFDQDRPLGVAYADLDSAGRRKLGKLVSHYVSRLPGEAQWPGMGYLDEMHFVWAGPTQVGAPHYYRLQSPTLVVEFDNVQNGANHVHTVVRHPANDFAAATLGLHHLREH